MIESKTLVRKTKQTSFFATMILCGAAIQNSFFDDIFSVGGMDAISLLLTFFLVIAFFWVIAITRGKMYRIEFLLLFYFFSIFTLGFIRDGINGMSLILFRTSLYFLLTFIFFLRVRISQESIIKMYRLAGFLNASVCMIFYIINVQQYGAGFRDVSINLYFSLFAIILCLFVELPNEVKWQKYSEVLVCTLAIVTSQQRTQIIPLIIVLLLFGICSMERFTKFIVRMLVLFVLVYVVYRISSAVGVYKLVVNRLQLGVITAGESTLWARFDAVSRYLGDFNVIEWLWGTGLTGETELEMLLPNYLYKYGIFGTMLIACTIVVPAILSGLYDKIGFKKMLLVNIAILAIGGLISGFGGQNGQLFVASILGLMCNEIIDCYQTKNIRYNSLLVRKVTRRGRAMPR